jgi:predicted transcriptional regulator
MLGDLVERVFDGSASKLVMQALSGSKTSRQELDRIREFLDEIEKEGGRR